MTLPAPSTNETTLNGDFDDYDPEAIAIEPLQEDLLADDTLPPEIDSIAISNFELRVPDPLPETFLRQQFKSSIERILHSIRTIDTATSHRAGLSNKSATLDSLAFTEWDKEAWITLLSRLSARGLVGPDNELSPLANVLRERLFEYIMINFREHMDLTISWLTEEWYNESLLPTPHGTYVKWATRIFDNILPFIENSPKDSRLFIRLLGDLPSLAGVHVQKLRILCLDPERQRLGFTAIKYLLMLRPPARKDCVELLVDLWSNRMSLWWEGFADAVVDADTKKGAEALLKTWAPERLLEG